MNKVKPCSISSKHKWEFVNNVTLKDVTYGATGTQVKIRFRGLYKCACGAKRIGQMRDEVKGGAA